jgi:SAM-dependent methyltransferase
MAYIPTEVARRVEGQRLAYYCSKASAEFWDTHWKQHLPPEIFRGADNGNLGWFEKPFTTYLPKEGPILEAGCGIGVYVRALRVRGYNVEGIEWGASTVEAVCTLYPDLPIRRGDVTSLEVPDGYYSGYISLGVVEHSQEGPELFLKESYRVLMPGGVALISVPFFHSLRRLKARLGLYRDQPGELEFYQYAFTEKEFRAILERAGFNIIDTMHYDGFKGVKDELPFLNDIVQWPIIGQRVKRWLQSHKWIEGALGHMILFICRKV